MSGDPGDDVPVSQVRLRGRRIGVDLRDEHAFGAVGAERLASSGVSV